MLLTCSFAYGNIWLNVIWDAFVCVLNAKNIFHKKKKNCPNNLNIYTTQNTDNNTISSCKSAIRPEIMSNKT